MSPSFLSHPSFSTFLARYVATRPYPATDAWNAHFPALLNSLVDHIISLERPPHAARRRTLYLETLCRRTSPDTFTRRSPSPVTNLCFNSHLLLAATHVRAVVIVDSLLAQTILPAMRSEFWGRPLNAAIRAEDTALVRRFLARGAQWKGERGASWVEDVVQARNALEILEVFWEQRSNVWQRDVFWEQRGNRWQRCTRWKRGDVMTDWYEEAGGAVQLAVQLGKEDVAHALLNRRGCMVPLGGFGGQTALLTACTKGMCRLAERLLGGYVVPRKLALAAFESPDGDVLDMLLRKEALQIGPLFERDMLLEAAKKGCVRLFRHFLEDGRKLKEVLSLEILSVTAPTSRGAEVLWYLLHRRAIDLTTLDSVSNLLGLTVANCVTTAAQRGNIEWLEAVGRHGLSLDDSDFYTQADCPLPIVAAKAFRQHETVEALKELGVADADPLDSVIARHFVSGRYPCDPPPFKEGLKENNPYSCWRP